MDCTDRTPTCHSDCEKYKEEHKKKRKPALEKAKADALLDDYERKMISNRSDKWSYQELW